jgi:hypothetical protein
MATNTTIASNLIGTPDRAKEINFTKKGAPKLNASNQPASKKPKRGKKK